VRGNTLGDLGALKTTTQKFYRINGGSTQLEGVSSDIVMPDSFAYLKMGERDVDNAMPWDKIDPADYNLWTKQTNFELAIANSKKRLEVNPQMKLIDENAKWREVRSKEDVYSLQIDKFKKEQKELEDSSKKFKSIEDYSNKFQFKSLPYEEAQMANDATLKEKRNRWHESLSKDIYVEEAIHVLDDLQSGSAKKELTNKLKKDKAVKS
jgi:carboxyl-terminal processing protease